MPYRSRIFEVTASRFSSCPTCFTKIIRSPLQGILLTALLGPSLSQAQPAMVQAGDIDWIPYEELNEAQRELVDNACCGLYVEPALQAPDAAQGSTVVEGLGMQGDESGIWTIDSRLEVLQEGLNIQANEGRYDQNAALFTMQGDIRIRQPGLLLTGARARFDDRRQLSEIAQASYLLHESAVRGWADNIVYSGLDDIIHIDDGRLTRCEPGDESWLLAGEDIELNRITGRGTARDVTLRIKDVPVLYLPWISFPINDERQTGFLYPVLGSTSDGGFDIATPYYLNLAPNYDMTLTPRVQTERGVMLGVEGRYLGRNHEQRLELQYLPDDKLYDPATLDLPDTDSPPAAERWLVDYDLNARLARRWTGRVNYSSVSDIDYFQDFGDNGFISTTQSYLRRDARLRYRGDNWSFIAMAQDLQLIDPTVERRSEPYRIMPGFRLDGEFYEDWGLEYGVETEYTVFDRDLDPMNFNQAEIDNGILVTGSRLAVTPQLSLPWSNSYSFITPTLKYRYASWQLDDAGAGKPESPARGVFTGSLDSGLIFEREVNRGGQGLLQTLEPRLYYLYTQYEDQSDIPRFDTAEMTFSFSRLFRDDRFVGKDRVGDANQLTLALTSRLYDADGREKLRASVGQIRYFSDRRVTLSGPPAPEDLVSRSHLAGEFSIKLNDNWRAGVYIEWDSHDSEVAVGNFQFQYQSDINRILNFGYRFREVSGQAVVHGIQRRIDQTDISGIWPLSDNWGLIGRWNYDLANERNLETIAGVEYNNCCWTVRVLAREWIDNDALYHGIEDENAGIFLQFELKGLGSVLGGNVSGILNSGISGYREREYVQGNIQ